MIYLYRLILKQVQLYPSWVRALDVVLSALVLYALLDALRRILSFRCFVKSIEERLS